MWNDFKNERFENKSESVTKNIKKIVKISLKKIMILFWYYFNHNVKRFRCKRVPINAHFSCLKLFARKKVQKNTAE